MKEFDFENWFFGFWCGALIGGIVALLLSSAYYYKDASERLRAENAELRALTLEK